MRGASLLVCGVVALAATAAAASPAAADTVLYLRGTSGVIPPVQTLLGGAYADFDLVEVGYPASAWPASGLSDPSYGRSVEIGVANLVEAARSTSGPLVVVGFSQGAQVVQQAAEDLNEDPDVPSGTTFIMVANPDRGLFSPAYGGRIPILDYSPTPMPETRFNTVVVVNEYDAWADPMTQPGNPLAGLNAFLGMAFFHPTAYTSDLAAVPRENITSVTNRQGGTTTTYLVPAEQLPLTIPLRQAGVAAGVVDDLDRQLRPLVDSAYSRRAPVRATPPKPAAGMRPSSQDGRLKSGDVGHRRANPAF